MTLTPKGRRWLDTALASVSVILSALIVLAAFYLGQSWKADRLSACVHGKAGWTCPEGTTP